MFSNYRSTELTFHSFYIVYYYSVFIEIVKLILVILISLIIYLSSIVLWSISMLDLKSPSSSLFKPSFVDCWLVCIIFIGSVFIDPKTCPWV